ncbi:uncharacterized protein LOC107423987 isoform X2 [Ziziphus jujuba]|uniref:Uncharacterized protein LOC107423987 isoform X2 n=1 Tax=Ziziphus jujuba TaxID=326968 RepID=A0A6P4A6Q5_ZIZJJ|nr:uncharacterized protein LOC107423987 isoform X2 [Ziziphus jujuba]
MGSRNMDLSKSFKLATRSLLTAITKQDICKAFSSFTTAEQDFLHRLFVQNDFETLCHETQVRTALDTIEQLVEEQGLDPLFSDKTNLKDVTFKLLTTKKNEIQYLKNMLELAEEQNHLIRSRLELLKKGKVDVSGMTDVAEKLTVRGLYCGIYSNNEIHNP